MRNFDDWSDWTRGPWRTRRGDIRPILLNVLTERPMHGYEIIRYLEERSHGLWRPSPGSVYPTLQLLEEEELVQGRDDNGKRIYELTERGRAEAKAAKSTDHFERKREHFERMGEVYGVVVDVIRPYKQLARRGPGPQLDKAVKIMHDARDQLTKLLETDTAEAARG
jgi:DNA-binding PadR family transcriptional regulator